MAYDPVFGALGLGANIQRQRFASADYPDWMSQAQVGQNAGQWPEQPQQPEPFLDPMTGLPANEESLRGIGNMAYGILNTPARIAQGATEEAGSLQRGGSYEAAPVLDAATLALGGVPKVSGAAGVFGGRLSKTANLELLAKAEQMAAEGTEAKSIWAQTGWFRGADGKWRYEIPDAEAKLRDLTPGEISVARQHGGSMRGGGSDPRGNTLGDVLEHPDLYKAYPELKQTPTNLRVEGSQDEVTGGYLPKSRGGPNIEIDAGTEKLGREALLHETQHNIQEIEGFASGANPRAPPISVRQFNSLAERTAKRMGLDWDRMKLTGEDRVFKRQLQFRVYEKNAGEAEARAVQRRAYGDVTGPPWMSEDIPRLQQILENPKGSRRPLTRGREAIAQRDEPGLFPQYAEQYPEVAPPLKQTDKKTGKEFLGKGDTPETKAFAKARGVVGREMKESGYQPFFPPEERFYADPSKYPGRNVDTLELKPKTQKSIDEYLKVIDMPQTRDALRTAYKRGLELGNANDWYAMGQLEKAYMKEFGANEGRKRFMDEFAVPMAATTSGNAPPTNFLMGQYLEYLRKNKLPTPQHSYEFPETVGGRYGMTNVQNYERVRREGGYAGLGEGQPKQHNFARSFMGDLSRGVMDEQMAGGMLAHAKDPNFPENARKSAFGLLEAPLHAEAARVKVPGAKSAGAAASRGVLPGNYQDVAWAGFKGSSEGPMINVINDAVERTHRLTGMPREEIVRRGILRKEIPIYAFGALAPVGLLANQSEIR